MQGIGVRERAGERAVWRSAWAVIATAVTLAAAPALASTAAAADPERSPVSTGPAFAPDRPGLSTTGADGGRARAAARSPLSRRELRRKLRRLAKRAGSASGIYVRDLGAPGRGVLLDRKEGKRRILASNQKLYTTAAALARRGAESTIETQVLRRGGITERGLLRGNLYLVGGGDPAFGSGGFARRNGLPVTKIRGLVEGVREAGIERIGGRVVADDTVFDRHRGGPSSGFGPSPYHDPLSGLAYNHSADGGDPAIDAAKALKRKLRKAGVRVRGKVRVRRAPRGARRNPPVAQVSSPPLRELVAATNEPSDNFYAEMLLKRLGAKPGRRGTTRRGARVVRRFARRVGAGARVADGSGLSRSNRSTPKKVVKLLAAMRDHEAWRAFRDSLPQAGREGTLAGRMGGTAAEGRCRAKTGTLSDVSALSGYCKAGHGEVAFSILMNSTSPTAARALQDQIVAQIARYRR